MPKSAFETVSAFANTRGGWIVLGVTQDGERFEVSGVGEPDTLQNDFLSVLHADGKVSHDVDITEHRYQRRATEIPHCRKTHAELKFSYFHARRRTFIDAITSRPDR